VPRHFGGLAHPLSLHSLPPGTQRRPKNWSRARAQRWLPVDGRQELLDAIYDCKPFRQALHDLGLTSNQVWGLTKTDHEWAALQDAALAAIRRDDIKRGTNAAYVAGCVCKECREHQPQRLARNH